MQATMDSGSLKHVIKALTCLARYGEDLIVYATAECLTFSATNASMTSYCCFKYNRSFFVKYQVAGSSRGRDMLGPKGQINAKSFLAILKHRTVEKTAEKCELAIVEGGSDSGALDEDDEDRDSLETKLIVRLHCKHGVVKTHRLNLNSPEPLSPSLNDPADESRLTINPKTLKDLLEHFPFPKGPKHDPKLIWKFTDEEIFIKGHESSLDLNAKGHLATELSINAGEFEEYDVRDPPMTLCFHVREFQATLALAESLSLNIVIRFTDSSLPIFIEIIGDIAESLFVIATTQLFADASDGNAGQQQAQVQQNGRADSTQPSRAASVQLSKGKKRALERDDPGAGSEEGWQNHSHEDRGRYSREPSVSAAPARKTPMKAVTRADPRSMQLGTSGDREGTMPPPTYIPASSVVSQFRPEAASFPPRPSQRAGRSEEPSFHPSSQLSYVDPDPPPSQRKRGEPLFLPGTQLSQAIKESGLGIENMDAEEFAEMLEGEGEEFVAKPRGLSQSNGRNEGQGGESGVDADVSMQFETETDELAGDVDAENMQPGQGNDSFDLYEDQDETDTQFGPTQVSPRRSGNGKVFKPLFDD